MKKEFIKLSSILCIITLVAALLLAGVNKITAPRIAQAEEKASKEAMLKIIPEADSFVELNETVSAAKKGDEVIGYCVKATTTGYGGDIAMMVGFDVEATVQGIEILSHSETAGLGAKITEDGFKSQFKGKNPILQVVKNATDSESEITAITGATISSRGIAEGIKMSLDLVEEAIKEAESQ